MLTTRQPTIADVEAIFRTEGVRMTDARRHIWDVFGSSRCGLSISSAVEKVGKQGIGLATVYRTVDLFEKIGLLRRIHAPGGEHLFVVCWPGHSHPLVCRGCGRVEQFEHCDLKALEKELAEATGFKIVGHELEVYGRCPDCR